MNKNVTDSKRERTNQINQTKQDFAAALLLLMKQLPFSTIKVTDLVEKAGYSRRTFYRHFVSLEEILNATIDELTIELFNRLAENHTQNFAETTLRFFIFWEQRKELLILLHKNSLFHLLELSWLRNLDHSKLSELPVEGLQYSQYFAIGGMYTMLIKWVNDGFVKRPIEMEQIAKTIKEHLQN